VLVDERGKVAEPFPDVFDIKLHPSMDEDIFDVFKVSGSSGDAFMDDQIFGADEVDDESFPRRQRSTASLSIPRLLRCPWIF